MKAMMKSAVAAGALAMSAGGVASEAQAQEAPENSVAVAIIDGDVEKLTFDDPRVHFVDLTPKTADGEDRVREGYRSDENKYNDNYSHGDIVASAFVDEYRKMDPDAHITIYTVDPFIRSNGFESPRFSMKMLREALPQMKENGVDVAITAFGVSDEKAGGIIAGAFEQNGISLFAATPNEKFDRGIYPAANQGVIGVGDSDRNGLLSKERKMETWVSFGISGKHQVSKHDVAHGASFAVARAGAYGAYIMKEDRSVTPQTLEARIASFGVAADGRIAGMDKITVRIGSPEMAAKVAETYRGGAERRAEQEKPEEVDVAVLMHAMGKGQGASR